MGCDEEHNRVKNTISSCSAADRGPLNCANTLGIGDDLCRKMSSFLRNETRAQDLWGQTKQILEVCSAEDDSLSSLLLAQIFALAGDGLRNAYDKVKEYHGPCGQVCHHATCALNLIGCHNQVTHVIDFVKSKHEDCPPDTPELNCAGFTTFPPTPAPCSSVGCPTVVEAECITADEPFKIVAKVANPTAGNDQERCCEQCIDPCQQQGPVEPGHCRVAPNADQISQELCSQRDVTTTLPKQIHMLDWVPNNKTCCKSCVNKCAGVQCASGDTCPEPELYERRQTDCCTECVHVCDVIACPPVPGTCPDGTVLHDPCAVIRTSADGQAYKDCAPERGHGCCTACVSPDSLVSECDGASPFDFCGSWYATPAWIGIFVGICLLLLVICGLIALCLFMSSNRRKPRDRRHTRARSRGHSMAGGHRSRSGTARRSRSGTANRYPTQTEFAR